MTVKELREQLSDLSDDLIVYVGTGHCMDCEPAEGIVDKPDGGTITRTPGVEIYA